MLQCPGGSKSISCMHAVIFDFLEGKACLLLSFSSLLMFLFCVFTSLQSIYSTEICTQRLSRSGFSNEFCHRRRRGQRLVNEVKLEAFREFISWRCTHPGRKWQVDIHADYFLSFFLSLLRLQAVCPWTCCWPRC
jgi:hypothetical protein